MYIQPPFSIPSGYSGNAFASNQASEEASTPAPEAPIKEQDPPYECTADGAPEAAPTNAIPTEAAPDRPAGIFSRFPFFNSLMPPPRHKKENDGALPEWVIIGIFIYIMLDNNDRDLLPFLLLLLLWD